MYKNRAENGCNNICGKRTLFLLHALSAYGLMITKGQRESVYSYSKSKKVSKKRYRENAENSV